jgi:hypothetical protein
MVCRDCAANTELDRPVKNGHPKARNPPANREVIVKKSLRVCWIMGVVFIGLSDFIALLLQ